MLCLPVRSHRAVFRPRQHLASVSELIPRPRVAFLKNGVAFLCRLPLTAALATSDPRELLCQSLLTSSELSPARHLSSQRRERAGKQTEAPEPCGGWEAVLLPFPLTPPLIPAGVWAGWREETQLTQLLGLHLACASPWASELLGTPAHRGGLEKNGIQR